MDDRVCQRCNRKNTTFSDEGLRHSSDFIAGIGTDGFYEEAWICDECLEHEYDPNWLKKRRLPQTEEEYFESFDI